MPAKRLSFRNRNQNPIPSFEVGFRAALHFFAAEFINSDAVKHALTKGESRETPIRDFFSARLPATFDVRRGEAIDLDGNRGPSIDLMIFDKNRNFPLFESDAGIALPAEALLASVEVKSLLTAKEIERSLEAARRLHHLKPFKRVVTGRRSGGVGADGEPRFFHCIFAYDSDLNKKEWLQSEYDRLAEIATNMAVNFGVVQRVYVANRGLISFPAGTGCTEVPGEGTALMQFYMHISNFLSRENDRRDPVPYEEYAGKMGGDWRSLRKPTNPKA